MNQLAFQMVHVGFMVYLPERYNEAGLIFLFNEWYKNISNIKGFDGMFGPDLMYSCVLQFKAYNFDQVQEKCAKIKEINSEYIQKFNFAIGALR